MCSPFSSTVDGQFLAEWATISSATEISRSRGSARLTRNPANSGCRRGVAELDTHDRFGRGRVRAAPRQVDIVSIIGVEGIVRGAGYRPVGGPPWMRPGGRTTSSPGRTRSSAVSRPARRRTGRRRRRSPRRSVPTAGPATGTALVARCSAWTCRWRRWGSPGGRIPRVSRCQADMTQLDITSGSRGGSRTVHQLEFSDVVVKRFGSYDRGEHLREWLGPAPARPALPGLAPRPLTADLAADPPTVTMSRLPGEPLGGRPLL